MDAQHELKLGWIGLGAMGLAMAKNLQSHLKAHSSHPLYYTNRTMSRGEPLKEIGGIPCDSIAELFQNSHIIFSSISDDSVLENVVAEIIASGCANGKILVDTSTVHPDTTVAVSAKLSAAGAFFVAAPAFGGSPVAQQGRLLFALAGPEYAVKAVKPFLKGVMGRDVIKLGEDVSKAGLLKTVGNFITASMMEVVSEAHVLAEKSGLESSVVEGLLERNYGDYAHGISTRLTTGAYAPAPGEKAFSDLNLAIKDVSHGVACAKKGGMRLEVGEVVLGRLMEAKKFSDESGGRILDSSSLYGIVRQDAGLEFETRVVKERDGRKG